MALVALAIAAGIAYALRPGDPTQQALIALMTQRRAAIAAHDLDAFLATVDPERPNLRTCEKDRFQAVAPHLPRPPDLALGRTDTYKGYIRAFAHDSFGWRRYFIRNVGGNWYVTEPTVTELGPDVSRQFSGITVTASEAEADLIDAVGNDLEFVRDKVLLYAPTKPSSFFKVRIATLSNTTTRCLVTGSASASSDGTVLTLRDVTLESTLRTLSQDSAATLIHEALHWVQVDHSADAMRAMDWWLVEGWPERLANDPPGQARTEAACAKPFPSYLQMTAVPSPLATDAEVGHRYVIAAMLIERLEQQYGSDAYWRLVDAFGRERDRDRAYGSAFATTGAAFYDAWAADARAHYC